MTTRTVRIAGWSARGLRCPDYDVTFVRGGTELHRVSLIQMPNGTGKTTTLNLLRAALSGKNPEGGEWADYPIHRLAKPGASTGEFILHLLIDSERYAFRLAFDFDQGEVDLFTITPSGQDPGFEVPRPLDQFLNPNFVRFFIFDGELAAELIDPRKQDAQRAIDALFQLSTFRKMGDWAEQFLAQRIDEQSEAGAGVAQTEKGLTKKRHLIDRLRQRVDQLEELQRGLEEKRDTTRNRIVELRRQTDEAIEAKEAYRREHEAAISHQHEAELKVRGLEADLLSLMRNPHHLCPAFAQKIGNLRTRFDRLQLPENTSREWFEELADEEECICGRPISDKEREHIRTHAEQYLGSIDVAVLNQMKGEIAKRVATEPAEANADVRTLIEQLTAANDRLGRCQADVERIKEEAGQEDPEVKAREREIKELEAQIHRLDHDLNRFELPDSSTKPEDCFNLVDLRMRLKREEKNLDEILRTASLRWKMQWLQETLNNIHQKATRRLGDELAHTVNKTLAGLMPDNQVRLKGIQRSLEFEKKSGASIGETLTVAYAFLTHLGGSSEFSLPLVIDTPAAPIDEHIRAEIGASLPRFVQQFIAFTISPERGSFTEALDRATQGDVQYQTLFRRSNSRLMGTVPSNDGEVILTDDACLVRGSEYFNSFQDDSAYNRDPSIDEPPAQGDN